MPANQWRVDSVFSKKILYRYSIRCLTRVFSTAGAKGVSLCKFFVSNPEALAIIQNPGDGIKPVLIKPFHRRYGARLGVGHQGARPQQRKLIESRKSIQNPSVVTTKAKIRQKLEILYVPGWLPELNFNSTREAPPHNSQQRRILVTFAKDTRPAGRKFSEIFHF